MRSGRCWARTAVSIRVARITRGRRSNVTALRVAYGSWRVASRAAIPIIRADTTPSPEQASVIARIGYSTPDSLRRIRIFGALPLGTLAGGTSPAGARPERAEAFRYARIIGRSSNRGSGGAEHSRPDAERGREGRNHHDQDRP